MSFEAGDIVKEKHHSYSEPSNYRTWRVLEPRGKYVRFQTMGRKFYRVHYPQTRTWFLANRLRPNDRPPLAD